MARVFFCAGKGMKPTARGKNFAGLDIGSSRIKVVCAEENHFGKNNLLSLVKGMSDGLRKGNIVDIDAVIESQDEEEATEEAPAAEDTEE